MMLCEKCKKRTASVHIKKVVNNHTTEQHLCEICAQESGEFTNIFEQQISVHDFLKGLFSYGFEPQAKTTEEICSRCGMSLNDFGRTGRIGCSNCYKTFYKDIFALTKRIHGASTHTGKVPRRAGGAIAIKRRLMQLKETLAQHIKQEEYEQAAKVRDEIREIEKKIESGKEG